jgi:hypothetical protein
VGSNRNKDRTQQQPNKQQGEKNEMSPLRQLAVSKVSPAVARDDRLILVIVFSFFRFDLLSS